MPAKNSRVPLERKFGATGQKAARLLAQTAADELRTALSEAQAALTACQNATPPDCTTAVQQEHDRMVALVEAGAADLVAALR